MDPWDYHPAMFTLRQTPTKEEDAISCIAMVGAGNSESRACGKLCRTTCYQQRHTDVGQLLVVPAPPRCSVAVKQGPQAKQPMVRCGQERGRVVSEHPAPWLAKGWAEGAQDGDLWPSSNLGELREPQFSPCTQARHQPSHKADGLSLSLLEMSRGASCPVAKGPLRKQRGVTPTAFTLLLPPPLPPPPAP